MIEHIRNSLQEAQRALEAFLDNEQTLANIQRAAELLVESFEHKGKAFSCEACAAPEARRRTTYLRHGLQGKACEILLEWH